jgi:hypothetical protein
MNDNLVSISTERLKELEALEASIPLMIEKAVLEYKKSNLKKLHERDKANPAAINMRVKRYVERHREEINKKRREKRQKEKIEKQKAMETSSAPVDNLLCLDSETLKVESMYVRAANDAIATSDNPVVRKQHKKRKDNTDSNVEKSPAMSSTAPVIRSDITVRFDL